METSFSFRINPNEDTGAQGIAFVIRASNQDVGKSNGGLGYASSNPFEFEGISNSLAVEFDCVANPEMNGGMNHLILFFSLLPFWSAYTLPDLVISESNPFFYFFLKILALHMYLFIQGNPNSTLRIKIIAFIPIPSLSRFVLAMSLHFLSLSLSLSFPSLSPSPPLLPFFFGLTFPPMLGI